MILGGSFRGFVQKSLDSCSEHQYHQPETDEQSQPSIIAVKIQGDQTAGDNSRKNKVGQAPEYVCPWRGSLTERTPENFSRGPKGEMWHTVAQQKSNYEVPDKEELESQSNNLLNKDVQRHPSESNYCLGLLFAFSRS